MLARPLFRCWGLNSGPGTLCQQMLCLLSHLPASSCDFIYLNNSSTRLQSESSSHVTSWSCVRSWQERRRYAKDRHACFSIHYQSTETVRGQISAWIPCWERGKVEAWCKPEQGLPPRKRFHPVVRTWHMHVSWPLFHLLKKNKMLISTQKSQRESRNASLPMM